jgi:hypothetical protein
MAVASTGKMVSEYKIGNNVDEWGRATCRYYSSFFLKVLIKPMKNHNLQTHI